MNLQEYFSQQRTVILSEQKKSEIFQEIRHRRFSIGVARRCFRSYKTIFATIVVAFVLFGAGGFWIQQNGGIDNLFFTHKQPIPGTASADYIAEIVDAKGERHLQNNKNIQTGSYLHNGDTIYLKEQSEIVFNLDDGSQANIIGPAIFSLSKVADYEYQLQISEGRFIKLSHEQPKNSRELVMDDITLTTQKGQPLNLQIAKNDEETMIQNHGAEIAAIMPSSSSPNHGQSIKISQETVALRPNDLRHLNDNTQFALFLEHNNLSEVFSLDEDIYSKQDNTEIIKSGENKSSNTGNTPNSIGIQPNSTDISMITSFEKETGTIGNLDPKIVTQLGADSEKQLPTQDQQDQLLHSLNSFFLMNVLEKIALAKLQNSESQLQQATTILKNKLITIQKQFQLSELTGDPGEMALQLYHQLSQKYYIAPSQLEKLSQINDWRAYLMHLSDQEMEEKEASLQWKKLQSELPENLLIK